MRIFKGSNNISRDFRVLGFVMCLAIFGCGYIFGTVSFTPSFFGSSNNSNGDTIKAIGSVVSFIGGSSVLGTLFMFFVYQYVEEYIEREKKNLEQAVDNIYREEIEIEFLSVIWEYLNRLPETVDYEVALNFSYFCVKVNTLLKESSLEERLIRNIKELKGREEALEGLTKGFKEEKSGRIPLIALVGEACNNALGLTKEDLGLDKVADWAEPLYSDITVYLKAWLVCSIKHGVDIPIPLFFQKTLGEKGDGRYEGKKTYIKSIKYIKKALTDKGLQPFFPTSDSRKIVDKYLDKLICKLRLEVSSNLNNNIIPLQSSLRL